MLPNAKQHLQFEKIEVMYQGQHLVIPFEKLQPYFFPNTPLQERGLQDFAQAEIYSSGQHLYLIYSLANGGAAQYSLVIHIEDGKLKQQYAWLESY